MVGCIMNEDYEFYMPFPPTVNSYYVKTRNGVYISKAGRIFREKAIQEINEQMPAVNLDFRLLVSIVLYPPDKRKRDVDNYMKALLDAITHSRFIDDDSQIDQLFIYRGEIVKGGLVKVEISEAGPVIPCKAYRSNKM